MAEYNGWKNYETWLVNVWLSNDAGTVDDMLVNARTFALDTGELAQSIKDYVENMVSELVWQEASLAGDLVKAALGEVYWQEIAESFAEMAADTPLPESV
jgi:hypothetical protein